MQAVERRGTAYCLLLITYYLLLTTSRVQAVERRGAHDRFQLTY